MFVHSDEEMDDDDNRGVGIAEENEGNSGDENDDEAVERQLRQSL